MNWRKLIVLSLALLAVGCSSINVFYTEAFFQDEAVSTARYAENWGAIAASPRLLASVRTESGEPLRAGETAVLRVSGKSCPGYAVQQRFDLWGALRERYERPGVRFDEVDLDKNAGPGPGAAWVLRQRRARSVFVHGKSQREFDKMWGIYRYDQETKGWRAVAKTRRERRAAEERTTLENGWLWQAVPCMPAIVIIVDGRVRPDGFLCGTPRALTREAVPAFEAWVDKVWGKPLSTAEKAAAWDSPITEEQRAIGSDLAAVIGRRLGLDDLR